MKIGLSEEVMRLLWAGKPDEARRIVANAKKDLQAKMQEIEAQIRLLDSIGPATAPPAAKAMPTAKTNGSHRPAASAKPGRANLTRKQMDARRERILSEARSYAMSHDGKVSVGKFAETVREMGIDLGVSDSMIGTVLGNILFRASDTFHRVGKGVFEYNGEQMKLPH